MDERGPGGRRRSAGNASARPPGAASREGPDDPEGGWRNRRTPRAARPDALGGKVRSRRVAARLSQAVLAARAGVSRRTVQRLERTGIASEDAIFAVEVALGLPAATLVPEWDPAWSVRGGSAGSRMRRLRIHKGFGLAQFAALVGLDKGTLSRMERGHGPDADYRWLTLTADNPEVRWLLEFRSFEDADAYVSGSFEGIDPPRGVGRWSDIRSVCRNLR